MKELLQKKTMMFTSAPPNYKVYQNEKQNKTKKKAHEKNRNKNKNHILGVW